MSGRPLLMARLAWATLALTILVAYGVVAFAHATAPLTICVDSGCTMTPIEAAAWTAAGLTPTLGYLFFTILWDVFMPLGFVVVAALIAWRKSDDWMALLVSFSLVALGPYQLSGVNLDLSARPGWQLVTPWLQGCTILAFTALFYLFPDGRFVPRWTRWLLLGFALFWIVGSILNLSDIPGAPFRQSGTRTTEGTLLIVATFLMWLAGGLAQVYRYLRVSDATHRQQTKWVVVGFIGPILTLVVYFGIVLRLQEFGQASTWIELFGLPVMVLQTLAWPASLGIAVLHYHLFDVDIIIRRTLIYGVVTALLAAVYLTSVVALQQFLRAFTGSGNEIAIIISTLAIAALFNPLRRRVQVGIDNRFYRRKYNAAQVLAAFGATVRDEVDLEKLTRKLLAAVDETMQPAQLSLWLRESDPGRKP